ncbi:MAG: hypothetical protein WDW38_003419 [Sanguina aurantia]
MVHITPDEVARIERLAAERVPELKQKAVAALRTWELKRSAANASTTSEQQRLYDAKLHAWQRARNEVSCAATAAAMEAQAASAAARAADLDAVSAAAAVLHAQEAAAAAAAAAAPAPAKQHPDLAPGTTEPPTSLPATATWAQLKEFGINRHRESDIPGAVAAWERCRSMDPAELTVNLNLSLAYAKLGRFEEAVAAASAALATSPGHVKALHRRAAAYTELGQLQLAWDDLSALPTSYKLDGSVAFLMQDVADRISAGAIAERGLMSARAPPAVHADTAAAAAAAAPSLPVTRRKILMQVEESSEEDEAVETSQESARSQPAVDSTDPAQTTSTSSGSSSESPSSPTPLSPQHQQQQQQRSSCQQHQQAGAESPPAAVSSAATADPTPAPSAPAASEPTSCDASPSQAAPEPSCASTSEPASEAESPPSPTQSAATAEPEQVPCAAAVSESDAAAAAAKGRFEDALLAYRACVIADPTDSRAFCNMAFAHMKLHQFQQAREDCEAALALDPAYIKARQRLAQALRGLGEWAAAREELQAVQFALPTPDPAIMLELAELEEVILKLSSSEESPEGSTSAEVAFERHRIVIEETESVESDDGSPPPPCESHADSAGATAAEAAGASGSSGGGESSPAAGESSPAAAGPAGEATSRTEEEGSSTPTRASPSVKASAAAARAKAPTVINVPPPAKNAVEFDNAVKFLSAHPQQLQQYVRSLDPKLYKAVFKHALSAMALNGILAVALMEVRLDPLAAANMLIKLPTIERFSMIASMALKGEKKEQAVQLVDALAALGGQYTAVAATARKALKL